MIEPPGVWLPSCAWEKKTGGSAAIKRARTRYFNCLLVIHFPVAIKKRLAARVLIVDESLIRR
jgi:hypothetical protein